MKYVASSPFKVWREAQGAKFEIKEGRNDNGMKEVKLA